MHSFGHQIPLTGREKAIEQLIQLAKDQLSNKERDRKYHPILAFAGCPGIGKTRMLDEAPDILANNLNKKVWDIKITFHNGQAITEYDKSFPVAALCWRILYSYFRADTLCKGFFQVFHPIGIL